MSLCAQCQRPVRDEHGAVLGIYQNHRLFLAPWPACSERCLAHLETAALRVLEQARELSTQNMLSSWYVDVRRGAGIR